MKVLTLLAGLAVASAKSFQDLENEINALTGSLKACSWDGQCDTTDNGGQPTEKCQLRTYSAFQGTPAYTAEDAAALVAKYTQAKITAGGLVVTGAGTGYCKPTANCAGTPEVYVDSTDKELQGGLQGVNEGFTSTFGCTQATDPAGSNKEKTPAEHRAAALKKEKWKTKAPLDYVKKMGSFKGYSSNERPASADMNTKIPGSGFVGLFGGFGVFFLAYLATIIYIFIDINRRGAMYQGLIEEDLAKMNAMGLQNRMAEFQAELEIVLKGKQDESGVDDQLVTNALELSENEYQKYM